VIRRSPTGAIEPGETSDQNGVDADPALAGPARKQKADSMERRNTEVLRNVMV
jgi:hypothetical protein